jgi:hypothetical protein
MPQTDYQPAAPAQSATRLAIAIGGCSLGMWCEKSMRVAIDPEHVPFVLPAATRAACDIEFEISWAESLNLPSVPSSFDSGGLWSAFVSHTGTEFYFSSPVLGRAPYKALWMDDSFSRGHLLLNRSSFPSDAAVFPLEYPIDELVMMHRLALGEGVELHALGLADQDANGYLFLGHSGAGKSTTARLWMSQRGVRLLSDDRIILRKHGSAFRMYGTPWHGDAGVSSADSAPLSSIFFLEQAPKNELVSITPGQAAAELFARAFVPHYLPAGIRFSLRFLDELTRSIPCATFRFLPNSSAVEAIRHAYA